MSLFLDLEGLGLAALSYPKAIYAARRREAARLGYSANETGRVPTEVELDALLDPFIVRTLRDDLAA